MLKTLGHNREKTPNRNNIRTYFLFGVFLIVILFLILNSFILVYLDDGSESDHEPLTLQNNDWQNSHSISSFTTRSEFRVNGNISLAFFYDPDCPCTYDAMAELKKIEDSYDNVNQYWYNISDSENMTNLIDFFDDGYNVPVTIRGDTPFLFIGDYYLHDEEIEFYNVSTLIEIYSSTEVPLWPAWQVAWTMHIAFFYDPAVKSTESILENVQLLNTTWNQEVRHLIIHNYSLENPTNKLLLRGYFLEFNLSEKTSYNDVDALFAGVFIGEDYLLNLEINYLSLNATVKRYSGRNTPLHDISPDLTGGDICVLYFFSPTCGDCHKALEILKRMKGKYPEVDIREYNIAISDNLILQHSYFDYYSVPEKNQGTLAVFIDDKYFVDPDHLENEIEVVIQEKINGCPCPEVEPDKGIIKEKFLGFTVVAVLLGGLVDSINPCAIATLIFFIGYLAATGRTKKQVLIIGVAYTLGIFIAYMALGLGIYSLIATSEKKIEFFAEIFYPIIIIFTFIFGLYSIYDYKKARKGKKEEMKLQLPKSVKNLIGRIIKHQVKLQYFVLIAIVTGVLISTLEFLCTGQVYLPIISIVATTVPELQGQAVLMLFLYNLMFILPLVIIFVAVYFGMGSERLQDFLDKNRALFKLLTAIVFFVLGLFLVWYSWEFVF